MIATCVHRSAPAKAVQHQACNRRQLFCTDTAAWVAAAGGLAGLAALTPCGVKGRQGLAQHARQGSLVQRRAPNLKDACACAGLASACGAAPLATPALLALASIAAGPAARRRRGARPGPGAQQRV